MFEKVIYSMGYQFNLFNGSLKEVSAMKHAHMKDSLKKHKVYFYHLVTRKEDVLIFDKYISSIVTLFNSLKGPWKEAYAVETIYGGLIEEILYKNMFFSPCDKDRGGFQVWFFFLILSVTSFTFWKGFEIRFLQ